MIHCYNGTLEEANAWRNKWVATVFSFNVSFCKPEVLSVASKLPLSTLSVESDCPYLGSDPMSTNALIAKIAACRGESVPDLKGAILSNLLKFLQPAVGSDIWPKVFEVANSFSRKPTNMSVLHRHVQHFTTNTQPQLKWSEIDLENYWENMWKPTWCEYGQMLNILVFLATKCLEFYCFCFPQSERREALVSNIYSIQHCIALQKIQPVSALYIIRRINNSSYYITIQFFTLDTGSHCIILHFVSGVRSTSFSLTETEPQSQ